MGQCNSSLPNATTANFTAPLALNASNSSNANGTAAQLQECTELAEWGLPVGIVLGVIGSIGINVGQNLQSSGIQALSPELRPKPWKSRKWLVGMAAFISFSLMNFAALAFAPALILTPLESIQFVTNVAYNRVINRAHVSARMYLGVGLAVLGTCFAVVFGPPDSTGCNSVAQLESNWTKAGWWVYVALSLLIAGAAYAAHRVWSARIRRGVPVKRAAVLLPIAYSLHASLTGGAQMIVQSKVFSEMLFMLFADHGTVCAIFSSWLLYVTTVLVVTCGIIWMWRLTQCLGMYDPLLILPLMVGCYIVFGSIAGGIFFGEVLH